MRQSHFFHKTTRQVPKDETSINAGLLIRAGYIEKVAAGIYAYLPLGLRVLRAIERIIREEMNAAQGQELLMPALTPKELWKTTGRWDSLDVLFRLTAANDREYALGATHEEVVVPLAQKVIFSYKELPLAVYQIQTKFRNEPRAKSGLLRGREFLMKDLYSFHTSVEDLEKYYGVMQEAYRRVYERVGLGEHTYLTAALGGSFSKYSHEFQTINPAGEDTVYLCDACHLGVNKELYDQESVCPQCGQHDLREARGIEVGNIFKLNTKYSEPFGFTYTDAAGALRPVIMGCYGIGVSRIMGALVEVHHDEQGMRWPRSVAPFTAHLVDLTTSGDAGEQLYYSLQKEGIDVLFDDRPQSAGSKLKDADLLGIPYRLVVSDRTQKKVEVTERLTGETTLYSPARAIRMITHS